MSTTTIHAAAINLLLENYISQTFYDNLEIFKLFPPEPSLGGDSIDWLCRYAGSDVSEVYYEGDPAPSPGYVNMAKATVALGRFQSVYRISGALRDYQKNGYYDAQREEADYCVNRLTNLVNTTHLATLEASVAASGSTYGGLTTATVNWGSSTDDYGNAGELTTADMDGQLQALLTTDRLSQFSDLNIYSGPAALFDYQNQAFGTAYNVLNMQQTDKSVDASTFRFSTSHGTVPWTLVQGMTAGTVLIGPRSTILVREARPVTIEALGKTSDEDDKLVTEVSQIVNKNPRLWSKLYV